jgi:hypothetical protein
MLQLKPMAKGVGVVSISQFLVRRVRRGRVEPPESGGPVPNPEVREEI